MSVTGDANPMAAASAPAPDATIHPDLEPLAVPIETLAPLPGNPRRGDVEAVMRSYAMFGQRKPIVARREGAGGIVLAGNHQLEAARRLGWPSIAVVWVDDDDLTAKAFALADNRTADLGTYDDEALAAMLAAIADSEELMAAASFSVADFEALAGLGGGTAARTDPDDAPEPPVAPVSTRGDVWLLGPHRLVCGDSTDPAPFAALMGGGVAQVVWTDPPYGIGYEAMRRSDRIANDAAPADALDVVRAALALAKGAEAWFVCCDWRSLSTIAAAMDAADASPKCCIVWDKQVRVQNLDRFAKRHEMVLYAGPYGGQPTVDTDVWEIARDFDPDHPTPKPVELIERSLRHTTAPGDVVLDPFGGSGSTLIAAHSLGRVARLIELDPGYCDVICRRYQEHTGIDPILEATGQPHDFREHLP